MRFLPVSAAGVLAILAACADQPRMTGPTEQVPAPSMAVGDSRLQDRYIVVFKSSVADVNGETDNVMRGTGGQVHFRYETALKGFAATIPAAALEGIRRNPNVDYVEADGIAYAIGDEASPPSWGLDRVDQHDLPLNSTYHYDYDGTGVHAYIIDTGIYFAHVEFSGRATSGYDFIDNDADASDCHGHGTHVAGTVGGNTTGIAKQVSLVAVRVLDCSGSGFYSQVIAGINWVAQHAVKPAAANMSLGGPKDQATNDAVNGAVASGVTFAIAAGNSNDNACNYSPASAGSAITVGATGSNDARASFSNYGTCLDIFAPGVGITSSTMDGGYQSWSGTSMATPHVAGAAALLLQAHPTWTTTQVTSAITGNATANKVTNPGTGSPNLLLYTLASGTTNAPPVAAYTYSCTNLSCSFDGSGSTDSDGSVQNWQWNFGDGATASGSTANHSYATGGTYTVTLTVTDNGGVQDGEVKLITLTSNAVPVHVGDLTGATSTVGANWKASATTSVVNGGSAAVAGATVNGTFSTGGTGSCVTASNGRCTITSGAIKKSATSTRFTVTGISGSNMSYASGSNSKTWIDITKP